MGHDGMVSDDPAAWLREQIKARKAEAEARCEADLAILDEHAPQDGEPGKCRRCITDRQGYPEEWADDDYPCRTVRLLLSAYTPQA